MEDNDDLNSEFDRIDEQRRTDDEIYLQKKNDELNEAWLHGVETGDYSRFHNKISIGGPGMPSSDTVNPGNTLKGQRDTLRAVIEMADSLPYEITSNWANQLDQMNLLDPGSALATLFLIKTEYDSAIKRYLPQPRGGLNLNTNELFRFASQTDRIAKEINILHELLTSASTQAYESGDDESAMEKLHRQLDHRMKEIETTFANKYRTIISDPILNAVQKEFMELSIQQNEFEEKEICLLREIAWVDNQMEKNEKFKVTGNEKFKPDFDTNLLTQYKEFLREEVKKIESLDSTLKSKQQTVMQQMNLPRNLW